MFLTTKRFKFLYILGKIVFVFVFAVIFGFGIYNLKYTNKVFPNVFVANINVSGLSEKELETNLENRLSFPEHLVLLLDGKEVKLSLPEIEFAYNITKTSKKALMEHRSANPAKDVYKRAQSIYKRSDITPEVSYSESKLKEFLQIVAGKFDVPPFPARVTIEGEGVFVDKGTLGKSIDQVQLIDLIIKSAQSLSFEAVHVPVLTSGVVISDSQAEDLKKRSENLTGKSIEVNFEGTSNNLEGEVVVNFLKPEGGYDKDKVSRFVSEELAPKINREPQDAVFKESLGKVVEFKPGRDGVVIDQGEVTEKLIGATNDLETTDSKSVSFEVSPKLTGPKVSTDMVNNMGIRELIGIGKSNFKGSILPRIHNINHASQKLNGVLIPPGETASFNDILGDVSQLTGYKQAYIIKDGKTILGDGGGVCQTSTTLFRAVLDAGLPVIERRAHAYRVSYYEQGFPPGLDATIYSPTTDFKFKNDTPGHILIQTKTDPKNLSLTYEIYGTSDGRVVDLSAPVVSSITQPPEDLYTDDPSLPLGKIQQVEHRANGARVSFNYRVSRNGEVTYEKTFVSNYKSWQAVYLRGTKPL